MYFLLIVALGSPLLVSCLKSSLGDLSDLSAIDKLNLASGKKDNQQLPIDFILENLQSLKNQGKSDDVPLKLDYLQNGNDSKRCSIVMSKTGSVKGFKCQTSKSETTDLGAVSPVTLEISDNDDNSKQMKSNFNLKRRKRSAVDPIDEPEFKELPAVEDSHKEKRQTNEKDARLPSADNGAAPAPGAQQKPDVPGAGAKVQASKELKERSGDSGTPYITYAVGEPGGQGANMHPPEYIPELSFGAGPQVGMGGPGEIGVDEKGGRNDQGGIDGTGEMGERGRIGGPGSMSGPGGMTGPGGMNGPGGMSLPGGMHLPGGMSLPGGIGGPVRMGGPGGIGGHGRMGGPGEAVGPVGMGGPGGMGRPGGMTDQIGMVRPGGMDQRMGVPMRMPGPVGMGGPAAIGGPGAMGGPGGMSGPGRMGGPGGMGGPGSMGGPGGQRPYRPVEPQYQPQYRPQQQQYQNPIYNSYPPMVLHEHEHFPPRPMNLRPTGNQYHNDNNNNNILSITH